MIYIPPPVRRAFGWRGSILSRALNVLACVLALSAGTSVSAQPSSNDPDLAIDAAVRGRVIQTLKTKLTDKYLDAALARQMVQRLDARNAARAYDGLTSAKKFAEQLTTDLRDVSQDLHLTVRYSYRPVPDLPDTPPPLPPDWIEKATLESGRVYNFGFLKVEILAGNVGLIKLVGFPPPEVMEKTMAAVMTTVAYTDALIIDVRENTGGSPASVSLLMSYFLEAKPITINTIYWRFENETDTFTNTLNLPAPRYLNRSVFAVTGPKTFSAGEEFVYDLQAFRRAKLVGQITAGAANPAIFQRLDTNFEAFIPAGRVINPITGTNWERVGVKPDVSTTEYRALQTAYVAALENILAQPPRPFLPDETKKLNTVLEEQRAILKTMPKNNPPPPPRPPHWRG
jgi:retinol-binding protein 3